MTPTSHRSFRPRMLDHSIETHMKSWTERGPAPFFLIVTVAAALTLSACGGSIDGEMVLSPAPLPTPTLTPTSTPLPTPTPQPTSWIPPASAALPDAMSTPAGIGRIVVQSRSGTGNSSSDQEKSGGPVACTSVPAAKLRATEVLRCAQQSLLSARGVRVETYADVSDSSDGSPRLSIKSEGVYRAPDRMQGRLLFTLWGASQHRSDIIHVEGVRYTRSENYNQVSGQRVVTPGWAEEWVSPEDRRNPLGVLGLDYATRFVADRGGIDPPDARRCGDSTIRFLKPDTIDSRKYLTVQVRSGETAEEGLTCHGGVVMTVTHWIDRVSFRPWRVLIEAVPIEDGSARPTGEGLFWRGQTVYSNYDVAFEIEPPG